MTAKSSFAGNTAMSLPIRTLMTLSNWSTIEIAPTQIAEIGDYLITVAVSDSLAAVSSSFQISVINTPPYFLSAVPEDFTMKFNTTYEY